MSIPSSDRDAAVQALELRIRNGPLPPGCFDIQTVVVRRGPRAYKTASLLTFGDKETGEVKNRALQVRTWMAKKVGSGFDFSEPEQKWYCEGEEVAGLAAFLNGQLTEPGVYHRINGDEPIATLIQRVQRDGVDANHLRDIAEVLTAAPGAAEALASSGASRILLDGVQAAQQRQVIGELREAVLNPATREPTLQKVLDKNWWIFGGRFIDKSQRRSLTVLDQLDIPLIRSDGALHIVELKLANVPQLIVEYRNHDIVGPFVNEAVGQAANYLRELDEQKHVISGTLGIDCRRAFATVVIGHPTYVTDKDARQISDALRTYNSHLSRIEVITYDELIRGAERALALGRDNDSEG